MWLELKNKIINLDNVMEITLNPDNNIQISYINDYSLYINCDDSDDAKNSFNVIMDFVKGKKQKENHE